MPSLVPFVVLFAFSHELEETAELADEAVTKCDNRMDLTMFNQSSRRVVYS